MTASPSNPNFLRNLLHVLLSESSYNTLIKHILLGTLKKEDVEDFAKSGLSGEPILSENLKWYNFINADQIKTNGAPAEKKSLHKEYDYLKDLYPAAFNSIEHLLDKDSKNKKDQEKIKSIHLYAKALEHCLKKINGSIGIACKPTEKIKEYNATVQTYNMLKEALLLDKNTNELREFAEVLPKKSEIEIKQMNKNPEPPKKTFKI